MSWKCQEPLNSRALPDGDSVPDEFRPVFAKEQTVRIVLGLYDHRLTDEGMDNLLTGEWKVTRRQSLTGRGCGTPVRE